MNRSLVILSLLLAFGMLRSHAITVTNLSCEDRANPLGIDVAQPRLGWTLQSSQRGDTQTAYEILAASNQGLLDSNIGDLWDSGMIVTNHHIQIPYGGAALQTSQQVFWKVRAWDMNNVASAWSASAEWTMEVLNASDWQAQWITGLQRKSMGYSSQTASSQSTTKWVQVDLGAAYPVSSIRLHPKWYQGISGYGYPVRFHIEISNDPAFASSNLVADQTSDLVNPGYFPQSFSVANVSARYVRVTATKLYRVGSGNYTFALSQLEVDSGTDNVALNAAVSCFDTTETSGWGATGLTDGAGFVGCDYGRRLRREFTMQPGLKRAIVHVSGLGAYELFVNGSKNGTDLLSPGWSYYGPRPWQVGTNETVLYDTRDITSQLQAGTNNAIGLILGNSFYNVTPGYGRYVKSDFNQNLPFGPLCAIVQIWLDYTNGTSQIIGSDTNWMTGPGAITFENVYAGEDYDARLDQAGWDQPGYTNAEWTPAVLTNGPGGILRGLSCAAPPVGKFDVFAITINNNQRIIGWNENNSNTIPATAVAGVVPATNWNNSTTGISLYDNTGAASGASFTISGTWGPWGIVAVTNADDDGTYNRTLLGGYANTSSGVEPEVLSIGGIPYSTYNLIVYFSSDTANRSGTIACAGTTYDFSTIGTSSASGTAAVLTQTSDTAGANPLANYAVFSDLTGSSETLTLNVPLGGGIAGFQIVSTSASNTNVYDLGQNATLMPQLQVSGPAGSYVRIIPSELLGANGLVDRTTCVQSSPPPPAWWQYTLKGTGTEIWTPQFFIQGCRYLQVQLYPAPGDSTLPTIQSLNGVAVHSTSTPIGTFSCSNPLFNQIYSLVRWAEVNNMESYLSDCPHRERLGWLEQDWLNGPSLRYNFDIAPLFTKIENDIYDSQWTDNGFVPNIAPEYFQTSDSLTDAYHNSPEWGSTFIQGAWQQYQFSGDVGLLQRFYPAMKAYLNYLTSTVNGNYIIPTDLGDWYDMGQLTAGNFSGVSLTSKTLPGTAVYYSDAVVMAQMAQLLGYSADAATFSQLATNINAGFNATFFNSASRTYDTSSQTANGMPLALGLVNSTNVAAVTAALVNGIQAQSNAITAGEVGIGFVFRALEQAGRAEVIAAMLNQTNTPGYGYQIAHNCTSLTERWDDADTLFSSQDHFMCGEAMEWFYHGLVGIQPDPAGPGFEKIIINPGIGSGLTSAAASYNSANGLITNQWTVNSNLVAMNMAIPPGSTATVYVPALQTNLAGLTIQESGVTIWTNNATASSSPGVTFAGILTTNGQSSVLWTVGSGAYQFTWNISPVPGGLSAVPGNHQVSLTWNGVADAASYNVKRSLVSGGPYSTVADNVTGTNYTDNAVTNGGTYYYVVSANSSSGESADSFEASATPQFTFNFGFETPKVSTYLYNPSGGSWTFTAQSGNNGSGVTANGSLFNSSNPNAPEGVQVAFLQSISAISQTISGFVPGANYSVTFSAAQRAGQFQHGGQTWNLKMDNSVIAGFSPPATATSYMDYTTNFTATAATHTLAFVGTDLVGGDNTVFLDNVRIVPAPSLTPVQLGSRLTSSEAGSQIQFSWPADHTGWRLQMQTNLLGTNWIDVLNANYSDAALLLTTNGSAFFRLAYP